ncbi:hypothetical protein Tco_0071352 [Tanacetum coccineum]
MVEGEEDDESYVSVFADSMLNDDVDDSGTRIQPRSHKENPKVVEDDDDLNAIKMKDGEKKDDNDEKVDDAEEKDNDDQTDHALVEPQAKGSIITPHVASDDLRDALFVIYLIFAHSSMETRNEQMQTPIPTLNRSHRTDLSSDKIISEELTNTVSPTTATTSKQTSKSKRKRGFTSYKKKIIPGSFVGMSR